MNRPEVVSPEHWQAAHEELLAREKAATRAADALAAERRRQPMMRIDKDYSFDGLDGKLSLPELFEGRHQLALYNFMFAPGGDPCVGCSTFTDGLGYLEHTNDRDTTVALVSRAPLAELQAFKERMGWQVPWYSSFESDWNYDFGYTTDAGETFGLNVFLRDGDEVFRTYSTAGRGVERLSALGVLDYTPYGRQEEWEDSPEGWPQAPTYSHGALHDEYGEAMSAPSAS